MVTVDEASGIIFSHLFPKRVVKVPVEQAVGSVLAETIAADRAFPPFNRVAMDGIAIQFETWKAGTRSFGVRDIQAAGEKPKTLDHSNGCIEVMTGAVLPDGTDTVIKYEDLVVARGWAQVTAEFVEAGQNIHVMGADAAQGEQLLAPGIALSPAEIALLASVGVSKVSVFDFPHTAVISSGDELVDIAITPAPHQIRRSNTYAIEAAMLEMKWRGTKYHFPDNKEILIAKLQELISANDVLILSGGVSKGKFDYIPEALEAVGVRQKFHQVKQRPGKPFWFGATDDRKVVFALPGNPVSTYMCFYKYIRPWLLKSMGVESAPMEVVLGKDVHFPPPLSYFIPVQVRVDKGVMTAYPNPGGGSGDFANLKDVTGFLELPANKTAFKAGEVYHYIPFRHG
jgi:molybdopterin molybdotransferase